MSVLRSDAAAGASTELVQVFLTVRLSDPGLAQLHAPSLLAMTEQLAHIRAKGCRHCTAAEGVVFVQQHAEAVHAIVGMNGQTVAAKPLKCSWGRHQSSRAAGTALLDLSRPHLSAFLAASCSWGWGQRLPYLSKAVLRSGCAVLRGCPPCCCWQSHHRMSHQ